MTAIDVTALAPVLIEGGSYWTFPIVATKSWGTFYYDAEGRFTAAIHFWSIKSYVEHMKWKH